jgi:hypothetical protein
MKRDSAPAEAGVQAAAKQRYPLPWVPAFAGEQLRRALP